MRDPAADAKRLLARIPLFAGLTDEVYRLVGEVLETAAVPKGTVIFRAGDAADCVYILRSGEVRIVADGPGGSAEVQGSIRRGETFGEGALLTKSARAASAVATLDSKLLLLRKEYFEAILRKSPQAGRALSKLLAERLQRASGAPFTRPAPGLLCIDGDLPVAVGQGLALEIARFLAIEFPAGVAYVDLGDQGPTAAKTLGLRESDHLQSIVDRLSSLSAESVRQLAGEPHDGIRLLALRDRGKAEARLGTDALADVLAFLRDAFPCVVLDVTGRADASPLRVKLLQQADRILFLDRWQTSGRSGRWGRTRDLVLKGRPAALTTLDRVAVLPPGGELLSEPLVGSERPRYVLQTEAVPEPAGRGEAPAGARPGIASLARLVRHLAGTALGLALGGGGARACAHVGVLRALEAEHIAVDLAGGTGVGALVAGMIACGHSAAEIETRLRALARDNPFAAGPRAVEKWLRQLFSDAVIEGLPIPFFAVAADLHTGERVVITDDLVWKGVRASLALPGILPPVYDGERCLVDGTCVASVPGEVARGLGPRLVVGVDVTPVQDPFFLPTDRKHALAEEKAARPAGADTRWLGRLLGPGAAARGFLAEPSTTRLLHRLLEVGARAGTRDRRGPFDVVIEPQTAGIDVGDYASLERAIEAGEEAGREAVARIRERWQALRGGVTA